MIPYLIIALAVIIGLAYIIAFYQDNRDFWENDLNDDFLIISYAIHNNFNTTLYRMVRMFV